MSKCKSIGLHMYKWMLKALEALEQNPTLCAEGDLAAAPGKHWNKQIHGARSGAW